MLNNTLSTADSGSLATEATSNAVLAKATKARNVIATVFTTMVQAVYEARQAEANARANYYR